MSSPNADETGRSEEPRDSASTDRVVVRITVTRSGGFAGLRRTWEAEADTAGAPQWIALLEECPWDAADPTRPLPPYGADRFVWRVDARCGEDARAAALADPEVRGPWRELIDAVRDATTTTR